MSAFFETIYNVITPILLVAGIGVLFGRTFRPDPRGLSTMIVYLFTPFLVLEGIANADLAALILLRILVQVVMVAVVLAGVGWGISRALRLERRQESALILSVVLINAANYGITFNRFAFGEAGAQIAIVYYVASIIVANTLGVYMASRGTAVDLRASLVNVIKIPLIYATIIGLIINFGEIDVPLPLTRMVNLLAEAAIPAMLILLGIQLSRSSIRGQLAPVLAASGARLIIGPLLAIVFASLLGLTGLTRQVGILQLGMPTAVIANVLAIEFGGDAELVTGVILVSLLGSVITLSLLMTILV